ncbi:MAG: hypothetical protein ABEK59_02235 [Halobacteria archaeon]
MEGRYERLLDYLENALDGKLRAVGTYTKDGYKAIFIRDDVASEFTMDDIEEIHHEMVLKGLGSQRIESLFNDESLHCSIYQFENTVRLHFVHEDYRGYYVSFDYDRNVNPNKIVEECKNIV